MRVKPHPTNSFFDPPDYVEVLTITHLFELPLDLVIPDMKASAIFETRTDAFVDWPDELRAHFVGLNEVPVPRGRVQWCGRSIGAHWFAVGFHSKQRIVCSGTSLVPLETGGSGGSGGSFSSLPPKRAFMSGSR